MSSKAEKERQKQIQDKCQNLLNQMLRDDDNKYCVDCDAKGPRWASWNLGVFLCIRCAGIHRNLGVHISKVKSVNLDTWTPEQVVSLQQMGNSRARAVYEANLPDNFRRPQTDTALEAFVRAKYESKKYIAREWVPPPLPKVNWDKELDEEAERGRKKKKPQDSKLLGQTPTIRKLDNVIPQPLPKPNTSPKVNQRNTGSSNSSQSSHQSKLLSTDLLGLDNPIKESSSSSVTNSDEIFSNFLSAPPAENAATVSKRTPEEDSFFNQQQSSATNNSERKQLTTDSILALYGKSPQPVSGQPPISNTFNMPGGFMGGFQCQPQIHQNVQFQNPNGIVHMQQGPPIRGMQSGGMYPVMPGVQPNASVASNPFFNMTSQMSNQPMNFASHTLNSVSSNISSIPANAIMLNQQMSGLSLQPTPASANTLSNNVCTGQTLATNLWQ